MVSDKYLVINVTLSRRVKQKNHLSRNLYEFQPPGLRWVPGWHNLRLVLTSRFDPKYSKCVDWDFCNNREKMPKIESFEDWRLRSEDWGFGIRDSGSECGVPYTLWGLTNPHKWKKILTIRCTAGYKLWRPVKCKETLNKAAVATTKCPLLENSCHRSLNGELRSVWTTPDANQPSFLN